MKQRSIHFQQHSRACSTPALMLLLCRRDAWAALHGTSGGFTYDGRANGMLSHRWRSRLDRVLVRNLIGWQVAQMQVRYVCWHALTCREGKRAVQQGASNHAAFSTAAVHGAVRLHCMG